MNKENTVNIALNEMEKHTLDERQIAKAFKLQNALDLKLKNIENRQKTLLFTYRILIVIFSLFIFYSFAAFLRGVWNL